MGCISASSKLAYREEGYWGIYVGASYVKRRFDGLRRFIHPAACWVLSKESTQQHTPTDSKLSEPRKPYENQKTLKGPISRWPCIFCKHLAGLGHFQLHSSRELLAEEPFALQLLDFGVWGLGFRVCLGFVSPYPVLLGDLAPSW